MDKVTIVLVTLVVYKIFLIGVGLWAQRRTHDEADFFLGGRGLGPVVAAISYSASSSSAWTLLGVSGAAFVMGLSAIWLVIGAVLGMLFAWVFVGQRLMVFSREHNLLTLTDFLALGAEGFWRKAIVYSASIIIIFAFSFYVAAQFQGAGNTFHQTFNISMTNSIVLGAVIIMIYTFLGGFWAVSVTDTVQGFLMAIAAILLPTAALIAVGGIDGFVTGLQAVSTPEQMSFTGAFSGWTALGFVLGATGVAFGTFGQPHLLVRFMALRDEKSLRQARLITVLWFFVVFGGMCFVGLVGHILIPEVVNPEYIFFELTDYLFPPVIAAVLVAAVLSAIMSTADSQLLVGASAVSYDLGLSKRFPSKALLISRLAIAILVVLAVVVSLTLPSTIFKRALLAWTALGAAFGPLVLLRVSGVNIVPKGVFFGMVTGFTLAVFFHFNPGSFVQNYISDSLPATIFERILSFVAGLVVLLFFRQRQLLNEKVV
ncbi:sodium/proline symporter [Oceanicoccus sp. KOV_DT_Chl]|uniref:sodium/proline symporter n=1 Tax=Oceanicoccus sp. KOV_DT_Chl TaxID=1904639 RepID=UPI000C7D60C3|nr:sodium/proline symporter [Oceanicoccus sp. KOV_DT_Chl]